MKFQLSSDLHGYIDIDSTNKKDTILLIPGDFDECKRNRYCTEIKNLCDKFYKVILVPGNHEYYSTNIHKAHRILSELSTTVDNFIFLQDNIVNIHDNIYVVGSTLWTDFDNNSPLCKYDAQMSMNDYRFIRTGPTSEPYKYKIKPDDLQFFHYNSKNYIKKIIDTTREQEYNTPKFIVMTHHAPSRQSIADEFRTSNLNGCYVSDMDDFILDINPEIWIHGHVHNSFDYNIGNTRVLCNPRGYDFSTGPENRNYNNNFCFTL